MKYFAMTITIAICVAQSSSSGTSPHVFAAVLSSERTAHGGEHLRRNLYRELMLQLKLTPNDPAAAMKCVPPSCALSPR